ncbi:Cadmium-exporting ATPase [Lentibacillus sp. JNUCC-1]|uniref:heavy metal translocating P-type ATPase n=1 Tax=Lentibacillus sp. JNUCC-1 TaxID=2654513 RepID=UPI001327DFC3|nr:Cadmium-exporting ATPase [Lentibacillus sp. JNUCC-1]
MSDKKDHTSTCCSSQDASESCSQTENNHCNDVAQDHNSGYKKNIGGETTEYRVYGMDCPSCAASIEKSLEKMKDIFQANVSYATGKLKVVGAAGLSGDTVMHEVEKLGFTTEPIEQTNSLTTYKIDGMDCGNCAIGIEKHMTSLPEVEEAHVYFSTGQMKIAHTMSDEAVIGEVGKLGYTAEPVTSSHESTEQTKKTFGFSSIILSGIFIAAGFVGQQLDSPYWLTTILFAAAIVISGKKPVKSAFYSIKSRSLDMNVLMSMAAIGAAIIGEWLEGAMVVWLFSLGNVLQDRSMEQTRQSIRGLMDMAPSKAWVKTADGLVEKLVENIAVGDEIVVKPGDRIPLDGKILSGETSVNQAPITGESVPVDKAPGDTVYAGTINESGSLEMTVTKLVEDTTLSKIIHMVEEAQEQRAPSQAFIDKFAAIYTPIVFAAALAVIVLPPLFGFGAWGEWAYKGLALLIVACPCALVISTPVAIVSAIGNAAKEGVLIKGGTFLEKAGHINAIAFDKTGTLTEGKPNVTDVVPLSVSENELLSLARTLEEYSTHPIAKTIVNYTRDQSVQAKSGTLFANLTGRGVQATIEGTVYYAGNKKLFNELGSLPEEVEERVDQLQKQGKTIVIVGTESDIFGVIAVADTIRPMTVGALDSLKNIGIKQVVMLTGDQEETAKNIAQSAHVNRYFSELMPEDKVQAIKQLQSEGYKVSMVGDGINDAPALATSELGIAMGGAGTDTAMETADIVLMADNLEKLPHTIRLSRKALNIIKQNVWFSLLIKFAALVLIFPGWLTLWLAVISDTGAAVLVILNSLRLLKIRD